MKFKKGDKVHVAGMVGVTYVSMVTCDRVYVEGVVRPIDETDLKPVGKHETREI